MIYSLVYENPNCMDSSSRVRLDVRLEGNEAVEHSPGRENDGLPVAVRFGDGSWNHTELGWPCSLTPLRT